MSILNQNNLFFVNENIIDNNNKINKEELNLEDNVSRNSISTNATFENDFQSDEEIDFNQVFSPRINLLNLQTF